MNFPPRVLPVCIWWGGGCDALNWIQLFLVSGFNFPRKIQHRPMPISRGRKDNGRGRPGRNIPGFPLALIPIPQREVPEFQSPCTRMVSTKRSEEIPNSANKAEYNRGPSNILRPAPSRSRTKTGSASMGSTRFLHHVPLNWPWPISRQGDPVGRASPRIHRQRV